MFRRQMIEIRLDGMHMNIELNNLIRRVNKCPFVRIDCMHFYDGYNNSARIIVSSPFRSMMCWFYVNEQQKFNTLKNRNITWL